MVRAILYIGSRCPFEKRLIRYERVYFYSMVYADLESYRYCEFRFLRAVFVRSLLLHQLISVFLIWFLGYLENFQHSSIPILNFITHQMFCIIKRYCTNLFSNHFPERKRGWICYTFISLFNTKESDRYCKFQFFECFHPIVYRKYTPILENFDRAVSKY